MTSLVHGTEAAYRDGCREPCCTKPRARRVKHRRYQLHGQPALVDAAPIWAHVDTLIAEGWTTAVISHASGASPYTLSQRPHRMQRERAARLADVTRAALLATAPDTSYVLAIGAIRRIRALQAVGWTLRDIPGSANTLQRSDRWITAPVPRRIAATYDRLSMTVGPSKRLRAIAATKNWPPPLCWDDDLIDDPSAQPSPRRRPADDRVGAHAERLEIVAARTARGHTAAAIADDLGVTSRTVERLRAEIDRRAGQPAA